MRVFVTGATGFIGSRIVRELIGTGHQVLGLTRSDEGQRSLEAAGAEVHRGTLDDPDSVARGAAGADAVIHTAFDHDFSRFVENCEKDGRVIAAMGKVLAGSDRPLIITSGTGMGSAGPGRPALEEIVDWDHPNPRSASERAGVEAAAKGVSVAVVRLPQVHDTVRQGLISLLIPIAREKGMAAYLGDGANLWPAAHVTDVARLYRLALERHEAGARYHAVAEEGRTGPRNRRSGRRRTRRAGKIHRAGRSGGLFRLARDVCGTRHARLERMDARAPGLAADGPRPHRGLAGDGVRPGDGRVEPCGVCRVEPML